eukprot:TRINITY_DN10772_c2_g1_i1.p1 TRINITY_DN10772_c2_g1~~TRINITY_DN10772_c2_g1_i1.p1  ORF type:complete len:389 (+),score=51.66 TRINITY_DN10772_c2_g1_i1:41-1207(+)
MKRRKLCAEVKAVFPDGEDRRMLLEGVELDQKLQRLLKMRASAISDSCVRDVESVRLTLVCYTSVVHGLPVAGATEAAKTLQFNFQLHDPDKETIPFTDIVKKIRIKLSNDDLLQWQPERGSRGYYVLLTYQLPLGQLVPSSASVTVDVQGKNPSFKLTLQCSELQRVLHEVYDLDAAAPTKAIGSSKEEIIKVFLSYISDNDLIDHSNQMVSCDRLLELEFDCKVSGTPALIRELLKKLTDVETFSFTASIPSSGEHQLPAEVLIGSSDQLEWLAKYNATQNALGALSSEMDSLMAEANEIFLRSQMDESFAASPHDTIPSWVVSQSMALKKLTSLDSNNDIRKSEAATDSSLWKDIALRKESLSRFERAEQSSVIASLVESLPTNN